jgi:23S rRNA (pseudouridine1915-N3)-methyltransferase
MVFHIVAVGRVRHVALREACEDYHQRANRYFTIEVHEVTETRRTARSESETRRREATGLVKAIPRAALAIALSREGEGEDSRGFAERMARWQREARDVAFVIGGASGLDQAVFDRSDGRLSLSSWTLPHELARLVLLEQIYRAGTILRGEPYHKGSR